MTMTPGLRKFALTAHVTFSITPLILKRSQIPGYTEAPRLPRLTGLDFASALGPILYTDAFIETDQHHPRIGDSPDEHRRLRQPSFRGSERG